ncbi:MAG: beta-ketoacyl-[acyl-carrier-protein] synthase II [Acidiferrobacteraceae bacterium]|jgi:3-oxoacyl-[acyl-carrier-protein] synthase II|nr:beta-ketoacyl-[acyl-carrier-protein] synthase II [Acidiferrobacteraceae bacterium]MDP6435398.1 beta-ketoacyl-ACP synthase II [Arenicellales bacterium]MDP6672490.1 beta-ketoacyl-ACP synthase II [Arenicellales bacterium]MDP6723643.1 beta-ketoacyl-ACP synthase II [Arenicellales bacterium]|tara:strand:+ start:20861 stop:22099 length:1239 start_codon:yes stop_codon:yes gene_type:complete
MDKRRVVISGLGVISPIGRGVDQNWDNALAGKSGIGKISLFDPDRFAVSIAGEVDDFNPVDYLPSKESRKMDRFIQFGMAAGMEALIDSGLEVTAENAARIGTYIGSGIGGVGTIEEMSGVLQEKGPRRISPFFVPMSIINMIAGNLSIMYGLKGPNVATVTACTTATHAIGEASRLIEYGDADVMVAGGAEAPITPVALAGFTNARALSKNNQDPEGASRPWDSGRDGFVMGEGAGIMVLEEYQHARARGARCYAELSGFGMSADAYHMTQPSPEGEGASRCMDSAMKHAGLNREDVDYINAHGTSTLLGDLAETLAIKRSFGDHAFRLSVGSTKSMTGHLLGAAGGIEAVYTCLALHHQKLPPTINLEDQDPQCDLDFIADGPREGSFNAALSNSFGFGGTNGTLAFKRL